MKRSYFLAVAIAAAVVGWVLSGQFQDGDIQASTGPAARGTTATKPEVLLAVRVRTQEAMAKSSEIVLFGSTEASRRVSVKAETAGRVIAIGAKKGDRVKKGDIVVRLAMDDRKARLAEAEALVEQRLITYEAALELSEKAFRSKVKLSENKAQLESAKAALERIRIDISHTTVHVPFAGVLDELPVEIGDYVSVGTPVAMVVDLSPILVVGEVGERDIGKVELGTVAWARLVTGEVLEGKIRYRSTVGSRATRTFRVEMETANADARLLEGMTAEMRLPVEEVIAHRVSPAVLTLSDDGRIGVKTVNAEGVVEFHPVTIVGDTTEGIWLEGLPTRITLITVGQEFVRAGQRVRPVPEAGNTGS